MPCLDQRWPGRQCDYLHWVNKTLNLNAISSLNSLQSDWAHFYGFWLDCSSPAYLRNRDWIGNCAMASGLCLQARLANTVALTQYPIEPAVINACCL